MKSKKLIAIMVGLLLAMNLLSSCEIMSDPYFQEGFRQGWNSTAPEQYRY